MATLPHGVCLISAFGEHRWIVPHPLRREFGVPPGGPFDRRSAALARALAGRPDDAPVLEITLGPVVFEAQELASVAVVGGPDGLFPLGPGERFEVRPEGARAYVAMASTPPSPSESFLRLAEPPRLGGLPIRIVAGPQAHLLDLQAFVAGEYRVGLASNRVGIRLEGVRQPHGVSLPSEPAIPGAIQMPPNGAPIVLGPDGPTIGGYPKVAVVIDADLDRIGRARPGDRLRFEEVTLDEARDLARAARADLARRCAELKALSIKP